MSEESLSLPEQNYGPGNVLRAKREEYEWSVDAVAEALHLSTHSVKAIEGDRYDELPGATYVIGYWRSYARLLGIDIEETIEANKRNLNIITAETTGVDINRSLRQKGKHGGKLALLLVILLAGFAYYAWQQQYFGLLDGLSNDEKNMVPSDRVPSETTPDAATVPVPAEDKSAKVLRPLNPEPAEPQLVRVETQSGDSQAAEGNSLLLAGQTDSVPTSQSTEAEIPDATKTMKPSAQVGLVLAPDAVSEGANSDEVNTSQNLLQDKVEPNVSDTSNNDETALETRSGSAAAAQSAPGMETMTLTINKDSWLDIRDKTRKRLYYETGKAGQKIDVSGEPPFYVYIGTPDGVTIQYRGKPVPFETHKLGMFARFKLDNEMLEAL